MGATIDFRPTGWTSQTFNRRNNALSTASTIASAQLQLSAIYLAVGTVVNNINVPWGSTGSTTASHWWFGLYSSAYVQLAVTADQLTATITADTLSSLAIANVASGAATTFTTTYSGLYYLGFVVVATIVPTLNGKAAGGTTVEGLAPVLYGASDTGAGAPPAFPHTATAPTQGTVYYMGTS